MARKVLMTSVCRPLGQKYGDGPSVGYELLFGQVTRAQGIFSPRAVHHHFSLEYIAENLDTPAVVLQYPSRRELIRELKKGYDYVGVSFIMATFHRMKEVVELVRQYSPKSRIVLGGYGTVLADEVLKPYADHVCRGEGVEFFRALLGEPEAPKPYKHPLLVSRLKMFSMHASNTGMIFAGLGCPNGCDFCCTSHFFGRRHIKLLPEGKDIYAVIERYHALDPNMAFTVIDEDFLLNKHRAMEFRDLVLKGGKPLSIFAFASIRALSQYTVEELLEMGIDGVWIGYEGTRSGYEKQKGRPVEELIPELREHGITVLASMIVGFDYQDKETVARELDGLLNLKPALTQYLIYGPPPGTPFYDRAVREGILRHDALSDPDNFCRKCDGFTSMVKHPKLSASDIEGLQRWCFDEDFRRLGPSAFRVVETWLMGYRKLKDSPNPILAAKAQSLAQDIRRAYPIFLAGRLFGPNARIRRWIAQLERDVHREIGARTFRERLLSVGALFAAAWTWLTLKMNWFQHPSLMRTAYRMPDISWADLKQWQALAAKFRKPEFSLKVEFQHAQRLVWLRFEGKMNARERDRVWQNVCASIERGRSRVVLDLKKLQWEEGTLSPETCRKLVEYRSRIRLVLPKLASAHPEVILLARMIYQ